MSTQEEHTFSVRDIKQETAAALAQVGISTKEIADQLGISKDMVISYLTSDAGLEVLESIRLKFRAIVQMKSYALVAQLLVDLKQSLDDGTFKGDKPRLMGILFDKLVALDTAQAKLPPGPTQVNIFSDIEQVEAIADRVMSHVGQAEDPGDLHQDGAPEPVHLPEADPETG